MTRIVEIGTCPVDLFNAAGLGTGGFGTARTPGLSYDVQNLGPVSLRYASAEAAPSRRYDGFRLGVGAQKTFQVKNEPTWAWVASGTGKLAIEV